MPIVNNLFYDYRTLFDDVSQKDIDLMAGSILTQFASITKSWSEQLNSEWTCRVYLATKMILNATALLKSLDFATSSGMRVANPYLEYYATLSAMRAIVYTHPTQSWGDGSLMAISQSKSINIAFDWLAKLNKERSEASKKVAIQLRAQRELISYKAPASGHALLGSEYDLIDLLTLLVELAQFNSELLERSVTKNVSPSMFVVKNEHIRQISNLTIEGFSFFDREDNYRLDYIRRKMPRPHNIAVTMTEGQTEDFIGAWDGNEDVGEIFNNGSPCDWQIIFDIP